MNAVEEILKLKAETESDIEGHSVILLAEEAGQIMRRTMREKMAQGRAGWWDSTECHTDVLHRGFAKALQENRIDDVINYACMIRSRENNE